MIYLFLLGLGISVADEPCDELKRDMIALELFLQDEEDHRVHCPTVKWTQPSIDVYKEQLKSQLPEGCKD